MNATHDAISGALRGALENLVLTLAVEGVPLSVRRFAAREAVSELFEISVELVCADPDLDLGAIVGQPARLAIATGDPRRPGGTGRIWAGVCRHAEQIRVEANGLSTYTCSIVPSLWLLGLRRDFRIFQHLTAPEIIERVLERWNIEAGWEIDRAAFPELPYKVQYGESDLAFVMRVAEEAGLAMTFTDEEEAARPFFHDALGTGPARRGRPIHDKGPTQAWSAVDEQVSNVRVAHRVRPGKMVLRDFDLRRPQDEILAAARLARAPEERLEQFHYEAGSFLIDLDHKPAGPTPVADDRGATRHDDRAGQALAARALASLRSDARVIAFDTNVLELRPGIICALETHPRAELADAPRLLVIASTLGGTHDGSWSHAVEVVLADAPFRPPRKTPKPCVRGVQSAVVVGPKGEEIHVDELGRVRVQFPWDREGGFDEGSSCWIRVNQGWSGAAYGMSAIPRIGHEVLVGFLDGDPDDPVIVGRLYNAAAPVPYPLPQSHTVSAWKSDTSPGSEGFNEIRFDDLKGQELFSTQAEKNQRKLVKNDETITIGRDRDDRVDGAVEETVLVDRTIVTRARRKDTTYGDGITDLRANEQKLVAKDEREDTRSGRQTLVRADLDVVVHGSKRERIGASHHADVVGSRRDHVGGARSVTVVEDDQTEIGGTYALEAGATIRLVADEALVAEGADITLKGPGGFVRIDAGGVTIGGTLVKINTPGTSRAGRPVKPRAPDRADVPPVLEGDEEGPR